MNKRPILYSLLVCLFVLAACSPAPSPSPAASVVVPTPTTPLQTATSPAPSTMPCTVVHGLATPEALGANFEGRGHFAGPAGAPVTIIVFSTYQCPVCSLLETSLRQVRREHPQDVRLIFITTPLTSQDKDILAFQAAEAADLQGKYWEMHDLIFEKRDEWISLTPADFASWITQQAAKMGLDSARFQADLKGKVVADRLQQANQSSGNPSAKLPILFVNSGSAYTGLIDFASLDTVIRMEALEGRQFSQCPKWALEPGKQYVAGLHTVKGDVSIELYADKAPLAVNDFIFLAESGWYNNISFYRVIPDSIAQTGDPSETGFGNPGYLFTTEISPDLHFNAPGMVAMDNSGINTNGSRFFITLAPAPQMEGQYTIIGKVLNGLDVLKALSGRNPNPSESLPAGDQLIQVTIEEH